MAAKLPFRLLDGERLAGQAGNTYLTNLRLRVWKKGIIRTSCHDIPTDSISSIEVDNQSPWWIALVGAILGVCLIAAKYINPALGDFTQVGGGIIVAGFVAWVAFRSNVLLVHCMSGAKVTIVFKGKVEEAIAITNYLVGIKQFGNDYVLQMAKPVAPVKDATETDPANADTPAAAA